MLAGRGLATAGALILVALACVAIARRLDRERRLLARLAGLGLGDDAAIPLERLSESERDTLDSLARSGIVRVDGERRRIDRAALARFRSQRTRFALGGALAALLVAIGIAWLLLGR